MKHPIEAKPRRITRRLFILWLAYTVGMSMILPSDFDFYLMLGGWIILSFVTLIYALKKVEESKPKLEPKSKPKRRIFPPPDEDDDDEFIEDFLIVELTEEDEE